MKNIVSGFMVLSIIIWGAGCVAVDNAEQGAMVGAAGGAIIGSLLGGSSGNALLGAIVGAAIGGAAGAYIGRYMDRQAAEMQQDVEGADVERVGEGIFVAFDIGLFFEPGSYVLLAPGRARLDRMAVVLDRYPDTHVYIEGRAYAPGTFAPDGPLAERRARVMADYLAGRNLSPARFTARGFSANGPSGEHIAQRRMGLAIMANDALKSRARAQAR